MLEEINHLKEVQGIITEQLEEIEKAIDENKQKIIKQKRYLWENLYELDPEEIASNRMSISEDQDSYELREEKKRLLLKLQDNTYFGKIDFMYDDDDEVEQIYIGLGGLRKKNKNTSVIYDWRAPISSMYYDFDLGAAYYDAPMGRIDCNIKQKRQLKIKKGELLYALDADIRVADEILQRELSENGSTKMRNIVATIQKEQNAIVRNQKANIMLVQGVAGSGKTSIALHRIAFLLYQNRGNLRSGDVLIISPNTIFSDYISNVLPELGEQNISEVSFDEMAQHELKGICHFETKYEQMEYIVKCKKDTDKRLQSIRFKKNILFLKELKNYVHQIEDDVVNFTSYKINGWKYSKELIEELYFNTFKQFPVFERLERIGDRIVDVYESEHGIRLSVAGCNEIRQSLREMAVTTNLIEIYNMFLQTISSKYAVLKDECVSVSKVEYEDVFPIVLLKFLLNGRKPSQYDRIKHVLVDEMQDYSMIQYEILKMLFKCKMTILGDINQVVDKQDSILNNIQNIFGEKVVLVKMLKSYRSTYEIGEFCRKLCNLTEAESFERHGKKPIIKKCLDYKDMVGQIQNKMDQIDMTTMTTAVVICKSAKEAEQIYSALDESHKDKCYLMNTSAANFKEGIIITNSYLVKGLEFDCVIVPNVTEEEYQNERERQLLYISCTRALHELNILYYGKRSEFIDQAL